MTYLQLRAALPSTFTIATLGGRKTIEIHNPIGGDLRAVNSKHRSYLISEADWNHARIIRGKHPRTPWASRHYTGLSDHFSYGLVHAASLLRHLEEQGHGGDGIAPDSPQRNATKLVHSWR